MKLHVIHTGMFKLDGGAMFGVVPKSIWNKLNPADEYNLCTWAMRCLLIEDGNKLILIDTGIGDKQSEKFFRHYHLHGNYSLLSSIKAKGFHPDDITDVFHTHLHFDHCGGGVRYKDQERRKFEMVFKNARYWTNLEHWEWAIHPNQREKASFLKENLLPMQESNQLAYVEGKEFNAFDIIYVNGHTDKQMLPLIKYKEKKIVFVADLLPSTAHIPLPYVMSYDTRPLLTLQEKDKFLRAAADGEYVLFFEHDPFYECATVEHGEKGVQLKEVFSLNEIL